MDISVVIPAYNESTNLPRTLAQVGRFLGGGPSVEIVVVDDGSADGTAEAARGSGVRGVRVLGHDTNRGKGAAVRTGVLATAGDVVVVTDADGNYITGRARAYLDALRGGADIVLASRAHRGSVWKVTPASARYVHRRRAMGRFFNLLVRWIAGTPFGDTQTGLKLFRGDVARGLFRAVALGGYAYDVEMLCRARRRGMRIVELPLTYCVPTTESRVRRLDPPRMALDLLRVRWLCRGERPGIGPAEGAPEELRAREPVGAP